MDTAQIKTFLEKLYNELREAQKQWNAEDVNDGGAIWAEYPGFVNSTINELEEILELPSTEPKKLVILSALYGASGVFKDVREIVKSSIQDNKISFTVTNFKFKGDPIPNVKKELRIEYSLTNKDIEKTGVMLTPDEVQEIVVEEGQDLVI
jgi:hypothetical protein